MASLCRSAAMSSARSFASRSKTLLPKSTTSKPAVPPSPFSPSTRSIPSASRFVSVLGCVESMLPLHSAIASARLKSSIALDSTCWSFLSQDASMIPGPILVALVTTHKSQLKFFSEFARSILCSSSVMKKHQSLQNPYLIGLHLSGFASSVGSTAAIISFH